MGRHDQAKWHHTAFREALRQSRYQIGALQNMSNGNEVWNHQTDVPSNASTSKQAVYFAMTRVWGGHPDMFQLAEMSKRHG